MTRLVRISGIIALVLFSSLTFGSPSGAQVVSNEILAQLSKQLKELEEQVNKSNSFVDAKSKELNQQRSIAQTAPEATDKMITDLEALINKLKAGSEVATTVQTLMTEIKVEIDKYREGSDVQKQLATTLRVALETFNKNDSERDAIVGRGLAAVRILRSRREDLIALRKVGAYQEMAKIYGDMIGMARTTINSAEGVVKNFQKSSPVAVQ